MLLINAKIFKLPQSKTFRFEQSSRRTRKIIVDVLDVRRKLFFAVRQRNLPNIDVATGNYHTERVQRGLSDKL